MKQLFVSAKETVCGINASFSGNRECFLEIENILASKPQIKKFIEENKDTLNDSLVQIQISKKTSFIERLFLEELSKELKKREIRIICSL